VGARVEVDPDVAPRAVVVEVPIVVDRAGAISMSEPLSSTVSRSPARQ
jgi:hypothetical protein